MINAKVAIKHSRQEENSCNEKRIFMDLLSRLALSDLWFIVRFNVMSDLFSTSLSKHDHLESRKRVTNKC